MRKLIRIGPILTILATLSGKSLAGVEYVYVESYGSGGTLSHAIVSALKEALIQVNGASINAESVVSEMMVSLETAVEPFRIFFGERGGHSVGDQGRSEVLRTDLQERKWGSLVSQRHRQDY